MNTELMEALTILEKEKNISKDVMMDAIENSLLSACKNPVSYTHLTLPTILRV